MGGTRLHEPLHLPLHVAAGTRAGDGAVGGCSAVGRGGLRCCCGQRRGRRRGEAEAQEGDVAAAEEAAGAAEQNRRYVSRSRQSHWRLYCILGAYGFKYIDIYMAPFSLYYGICVCPLCVECGVSLASPRSIELRCSFCAPRSGRAPPGRPTALRPRSSPPPRRGPRARRAPPAPPKKCSIAQATHRSRRPPFSTIFFFLFCLSSP